MKGHLLAYHDVLADLLFTSFLPVFSYPLSLSTFFRMFMACSITTTTPMDRANEITITARTIFMASSQLFLSKSSPGWGKEVEPRRAGDYNSLVYVRPHLSQYNRPRYLRKVVKFPQKHWFFQLVDSINLPFTCIRFKNGCLSYPLRLSPPI